MTKNQKTLRQAQGAERSRSITKEMTISQVIEKCPKAVFVFIDYGIHCVGCPLAKNDPVEGAAKLHRLDLEKLLADLNKACPLTDGSAK